MKGASAATATPVKEKTMAEKAAHFFTTCQQENSSRLWFPCIGKAILWLCILNWSPLGFQSLWCRYLDSLQKAEQKRDYILCIKTLRVQN